MRLKKRNARKVTKLATLLLGLCLIGAGLVSAIGQVMAAGEAALIAYIDYKERGPIKGIELAWEDYFDPEYSKGVVYRYPKAYSNWTDRKWESVTTGTSDCKKTVQDKIKDNPSGYFCGNNKKKVDGKYTTFYNAAIYNNEWLAIREWDWISSGDKAYYALNRNTGGMTSDQGSLSNKYTSTTITREIHFYHQKKVNGKWTIEDPKRDEVKDFHGIMSFGDFDWMESIKITAGLGQAYVNRTTAFDLYSARAENPEWLMTGGETKKKWDGQYSLWLGIKSSPITIKYGMPVLNRGILNNTSSKVITYSLDGDIPSNTSYKKYDIVANRSKYTVQGSPTLPDGYTFSGWHTDKKYTNRSSLVSSPTKITDKNITLYGNIEGPETEDTATVNTTITNGEITPSKTNVSAGKSWKVSYDCNTGYHLDTITIDEGTDGETELDIADYSDSYTFDNIVKDSTHSVSVSCVEGAADTDEENDDDNDEDTIDIMTSIENGVITDSEEIIEEGTDFKVEYKCSDGYNLSVLKIDNEEADIEKYPDSYTFEGITRSHTISAICKNGEEDIKTPNTGSVNSTNYDADSTTGGSVNVGILALSALASTTGFAIVYRFIKHNKAMSFKK